MVLICIFFSSLNLNFRATSLLKPPSSHPVSHPVLYFLTPCSPRSPNSQTVVGRAAPALEWVSAFSWYSTAALLSTSFLFFTASTRILCTSFLCLVTLFQQGFQLSCSWAGESSWLQKRFVALAFYRVKSCLFIVCTRVHQTVYKGLYGSQGPKYSTPLFLRTLLSVLEKWSDT